MSDGGNSTIAIPLSEIERKETAAPPPPSDVCTPDEANELLTDLFRAHTERQEARNESSRLDKEMKACKGKLIPFMRAYKQERIGIEEEGKYFSAKFKEKNRGAKMADLLQMIERDYGEGKRKEYERELETLSKRKVRVQDNRITYMNMRRKGEKCPGATPARKRTRTE